MQTSISIDKETRDLAAKRASVERMPLAMVVRVLLIDYAKGNISIGTNVSKNIHSEIIAVDAKTQGKMDSVVKQWRGKMKK